MWSVQSRTILIPILYLFVLFTLPIFVIFFIPVALIRRFVSLLGQIFGGPSLGKILTASATSHACIESRGTCILPFTLKGIQDLVQIKDQFTDKVLNGKGPAGQLLYPELRQTVISWGGYRFWKDVLNFQLPIRILDIPQPVDLSSPSGLQILRSLYRKEWKFGECPLWELLVIPGLDGNFGLVFIFHHALCDVLSIQKLINRLSNPSIVAEVKSRSPRPFEWICTLFRIPYDAALYLESVMRTTLFSRREPFPSYEVIASDPHSDLTLTSATLPLPDLKKIAIGHDVSVNAVLMSFIQASLEKVWKENGNNILYFPTPPASSHPEKLRNVGGMAYVELRQGQDRLRRIQSQLERMKLSGFPMLVTIAGTFSGSLPSFLLSRTINGASKNFRTILLSTFVVSRHPFALFGCPVVRMETFGSDHAGTRVVAFFAFSSADLMRFAVMGDQTVISEDEGKAMIQGVLEEFESLKNALEPVNPSHINVTVEPQARTDNF